MKIILIALLITIGLPFLATEVTVAADQQEIIVSAAISLKNAFEEIGKLFEGKYKGVKVTFNFGASGDLVRQIEGGAPVDVFASAAQKDMDEAEKKGLVVPNSRLNFAGNSIVLIIPADSKIRIQAFQDLGLNQVGKIAAGNPKTVPAGRYAEEVFIHFKLLPAIKEKLIYGENVRQVLDYVALGEFGATLMLAGNIPGKTDTMPLAIYSLAGSGEWSQANVMVILLTQRVSGLFLYFANRYSKRII